MQDCPFNVGVNVITCTTCTCNCGWVPAEIQRRKNLIKNGAGLVRNKKGLRQLKFKLKFKRRK